MSKEESVWDYPRPPRLEPFSGHLRIVHQGEVIADSNRVMRMLETSHPPTYYIPMEDVNMEFLTRNNHRSGCEFKGIAQYFDLEVGEGKVKNVGWTYPQPTKKYQALENHVCFYASKLDECYVNDERVQSQEGDFYGGWITNNIKGPFKGGAGTFGW